MRSNIKLALRVMGLLEVRFYFIIRYMQTTRLLISYPVTNYGTCELVSLIADMHNLNAQINIVCILH